MAVFNFDLKIWSIYLILCFSELRPYPTRYINTLQLPLNPHPWHTCTYFIHTNSTLSQKHSPSPKHKILLAKNSINYPKLLPSTTNKLWQHNVHLHPSKHPIHTKIPSIIIHPSHKCRPYSTSPKGRFRTGARGHAPLHLKILVGWFCIFWLHNIQRLYSTYNIHNMYIILCSQYKNIIYGKCVGASKQSPDP